MNPQYYPPMSQPQQYQQNTTNGNMISVKAKYQDWIRRFIVPVQTPLDFFFVFLSQAFRVEISGDNCIVQYRDDEKDLITTTNEQEWQEAKANFSTPIMYIELREKKPVDLPKKVPTTQPKIVQLPTTTQSKINITPTVTTPQKTKPIEQKQQSSPQFMPGVATYKPIQTFTPPQNPPPQTSTPPVQQQQPKTVEESWTFVAVNTSNTSQEPVSYQAKFISDANYPDGSVVYEGQQITKRWIINNFGTTQWPANVRLLNKDTNPPYEIVSTHVPQAKPGENVEVSVTFIPKKTGNIKGYFRLSTDNYQFGHLSWFELMVEPIPVAEAPQNQQNQQMYNQQMQELNIEDINEVSDEEDDMSSSIFDASKMEALYQKYKVQLDTLNLMGMSEKDILVEILEENGGDVNATIQEYIMKASKM